jgi:hypothetical protein
MYRVLSGIAILSSLIVVAVSDSGLMPRSKPVQHSNQPSALTASDRAMTLLAAMERRGYRIEDGIHVVAVRADEVANGYNDRLYAIEVRDGRAKLLMDEPATTDPEPRDEIYRDFIPYGGKAFIGPGQYRFRRNGRRRALMVIGEPTPQQRGRMNIIFDTNGNNRPDRGDTLGSDAGLAIFALHSPYIHAEPNDVTATGCIALQSRRASTQLLSLLPSEFWLTVLTEDDLRSVRGMAI